MLSRSDFGRQIRLLLENMHDFSYLQSLPLTRALCASDRTVDQSVRLLRQGVLSAIEELAPPESMPPRAKERRPYALLYGRYIQGMATGELVEELAISVRQLRRENKRALSAITNLMWDRLSGLSGLDATNSADGKRTGQGVAVVEAEQLIEQGHAEALSVQPLVANVLSVLTPIATERGTVLDNQLPECMPPVRTDRVALRQAVFQLISYAMHHVKAKRIVIEQAAGSAIGLQIIAEGETLTGESASNLRLDVSQRLITGVGGQLTTADAPGRWQATIKLPAEEAISILVMDDNQTLVELFRRYLGNHRYRVIHAVTAEEALQRSREAEVRLIILDIMMPEEDGWEILQRLRAAPEVERVPIIVCSVLNEPEIARALGASDYVTKPVTQDVLLEKIERWSISRS